MKKLLILAEMIIMFFTCIFGKIAELPFFPNPEDGTTTSVSEETSTTESLTENSDEDIEHVDPPYMFLFTLENFPEFKKAYETMDEEEFLEFADAMQNTYGSANINNKEDAKRIIERVEETTVALFDGSYEDFQKMYFYVESDWMFQRVLINERSRIMCTYYSLENASADVFSFDNVEGAEFIKESTCGDITAKIYYCNDWLYAETSVDETFINFRSMDKAQTLEGFESELSGLEFAKIGDLIDEINASNLTVESSELTITEIAV